MGDRSGRRSRMRIAVLAAGYADGVPHRLSNKGKVIAGGRLGTDSRDRVDGCDDHRYHPVAAVEAGR